ncbi:hypothetical protein PIB30_084877 [Stylosanthes scabra]|uniref:Uncharacterized protein n=1 Tax=Stylosanthes scabra TaxID=79078 RepID=A0ABU6WSM7_9FABA|nr:hypothetical protein [Stylosanthes scabra]
MWVPQTPSCASAMARLAFSLERHFSRGLDKPRLSESQWTKIFLIDKPKAKVSPAMRASYSDWLLLAEKQNLIDCSKVCILPSLRMIPAPAPWGLDAPSTWRVHCISDVEVSGAESYTTKSASACDFNEFLA